MSVRRQISGALVGRLIAGGDPQAPNAREEIGGGVENSHVGETKPGSGDDVIPEGREAAWAARLRRGRHGQGRRLASTGGVAHEARSKIIGFAENGSAVEIERGSANRGDIDGRQPSVSARDKRTGVARAGQGSSQGAGRRRGARA